MDRKLLLNRCFGVPLVSVQERFQGIPLIPKFIEIFERETFCLSIMHGKILRVENLC